MRRAKTVAVEVQGHNALGFRHEQALLTVAPPGSLSAQARAAAFDDPKVQSAMAPSLQDVKNQKEELQQLRIELEKLEEASSRLYLEFRETLMMRNAIRAAIVAAEERLAAKEAVATSLQYMSASSPGSVSSSD